MSNELIDRLLADRRQAPDKVVGFDDMILSLYAHGMKVREIQAHLEEMYGA